MNSVLIRKIDPHNPEDMRRISLIDKSADVIKQMVGKQLDDEELFDFVANEERKTLYGVSGWRLVPKNEVGKLQGWVMIYIGKDVDSRAKRALGRKFLTNSLPVLEVSYAKFPGSPSGQIACGLRQALLDIARKDGVDLSQARIKYPRLVIAFVDPENIKSRYVLEASGFTVQPKKALWDPQTSKRKDLVYVLDWQRLQQKIFGK